MIFAIGLVCFIVGTICIRVFGAPIGFPHTSVDYFGVTLVFVGAIAMVASVCMLAWRYLP